MSISIDAWRSDAAAPPAPQPAAGEIGTRFASLMGQMQAAPQLAPQAASQPAQPAATSPAPSYTIASGDTLSGIVQNLAQQRGLALSGEQRHRLALELATRNQISNPNRIMPGQVLQLGTLQSAMDQIEQSGPTAPALASLKTASAPGPTPSTQDWLARRAQPLPPATSTSALLSPQTQRAIPNFSQIANPALSGSPLASGTSVLQQTLDRAVARGFIPAQDRQAVQDKILQLSQKYRFAPDDFARMTLMESDGMNPKASNQRCHGIIQFCDGPNRGAATVGFAQQPKAILGLSVYQQLSLVDTYFQEAGLGKQGPATLDDLYLTVLQPAARQEKQPHVPLNIPGQQARDLHPGADTSQAITRQSIIQGLLKNTRDKLGNLFGQNVPPRPAAAQVSLAPNDRNPQLR